MKYYSALKKEVLLLAEPKGIILNKISQIEKEKYCMVSLICKIIKKKKLNSYGMEWWLPGFGDIERGW